MCENGNGTFVTLKNGNGTISHLHLLLQLVEELPLLTGGRGEGGALATHDSTGNVLNTIIQTQLRTRGRGRGDVGREREG